MSLDRKPSSTPAPEWMPAQYRLIYPGWVQRKAVTRCKRDQKRGGTGNVQQYRLLPSMTPCWPAKGYAIGKSKPINP